jgi:Na+/H+-translocating membrane pyrophosphatase
MIVPGLLAIIAPIAVGFAGPTGSKILAGLLAGSIASGFLLAVVSCFFTCTKMIDDVKRWRCMG